MALTDDYAILREVGDLSVHRKAHIGDALEYIYRFWTKHLLGTPSNTPHLEEVQNGIDKFFAVHLLHWIEVLTITGDLDIGIYSLNDIGQWCSLVSVAQFAAKTYFYGLPGRGCTKVDK